MPMTYHTYLELLKNLSVSYSFIYSLAFLSLSLRRSSIRKTRFMTHLSGKLRRSDLVYFKKNYVHKQLLIRIGECSQCGSCCLFLFNCPMLTHSGLCLIYNRYRPQACCCFPIDQRDVDEVELMGGKCGYQFLKQASGVDEHSVS
jgi:hypothetical protein